MKILLIGSDFFDYTNALCRAFAELGNEVACCVLKDNWSKTPAGILYYEAVRVGMMLKGMKNPVGIHSNKIIQEQNQRVIKLYDKFKPDVVISYAGYVLGSSALEYMHGCRKVFWIYDAYERLSDRVKHTLLFYDEIFTFEKNDLQYYDQLGIRAYFLPLCADNRVYYPVECKKEVDVSFVGALTKERISLFREIHRKMPDISMKIYGRYIGKHNLLKKASRKIRSEKEVFINQGLTPESVNDLYAKSKICINLHRRQSCYGANIRLYELMAAGAFQITDRNPYITDNFKGCLETFGSIDELLKQLDYYLKNEEERKRIAQNGYRKAVHSELFIHRAETLLNRLTRG